MDKKSGKEMGIEMHGGIEQQISREPVAFSPLFHQSFMVCGTRHC